MVREVDEEERGRKRENSYGQRIVSQTNDKK